MKFFLCLVLCLPLFAAAQGIKPSSAVSSSGIVASGSCLTLVNSDGTTAQQWCPNGTGASAFKNSTGSIVADITSGGTLTLTGVVIAEGLYKNTSGTNSILNKIGSGTALQIANTSALIATDKLVSFYSDNGVTERAFIGGGGAITSSASAATNGLVLTNDTARLDLGPGADDYFYASGNVINTPASIVSGRSFTSGTGSGNNAVAVQTNGARIDYGAGASDYASSNGTTVTFAGPTTTTGLLTATGGLQPGSTSGALISETSGNITYKNNGASGTTAHLFNTTNTYSAGTVFQVQNNGTNMLQINYSGTGVFAGSVSASTISATQISNQFASTTSVKGTIADSGTAVGTVLDNTIALSTSGALITSFRNNAVQKASVDKDGLGTFNAGVKFSTDSSTVTKSYTGTLTYNFGAAGAVFSCQNSTAVTVTNAALGDRCLLGIDTDMSAVTGQFTCEFTAANTGVIKYCGAVSDPGNATFTLQAIR